MKVNILHTFGGMLFAAMLLVSPAWAQESGAKSKSTPRPPSPHADSSEEDEESAASSTRSTAKTSRSSNDEDDGSSGAGSTSGSNSTSRHTGSDDRTGRIGSPGGNSRAGSDGTGPSGAGSRPTPSTSRGNRSGSAATGSTRNGRSSHDDDDDGMSGAGSTSGSGSTSRHTGSDDRTGRIGSPGGNSRAGSDGTGPSGAGSRSTPGTSREDARGSRDKARSSTGDTNGSGDNGRSGSRAGIGRFDSDYSSGRDRSPTDDRSERSSRERDGSRDRSSRADDQNSARTRSAEDSPRERLREDVRDTARDVRDTVRDAQGVASSVRDKVSRQTRAGHQDFDANTARAVDIGLWFNRSTSDGLIIRDISNSGPIAQLGFRDGDQFVSIDGSRVNSEREFMQGLFHQDSLTQRVPVVIDRKGAQRTIYVEPSALIEHSTTVQTDPLETFGLVLDDRHEDRLTVWKVIPRSAAYYAGVRSGDVITAWDNKRLTSKADMELSLQNATEGEEVHLTVYRGQEPRQIEAEIPRLASSTDASSGRQTNYRPRIDAESNEGDSSSTETRPTRSNVPGVLPRSGILPRNR